MKSIMELFKLADENYSKIWKYYNDNFEGDTSDAEGKSEILSMEDIDINEIKNLPDCIVDEHGDEIEIDYNISEIEKAKRIYVIRTEYLYFIKSV